MELISHPKGHKVIGVKWLYKVKKNAKEEEVVKGSSQRGGINYDEVFSRVA